MCSAALLMCRAFVGRSFSLKIGRKMAIKMFDVFLLASTRYQMLHFVISLLRQ